MDLPVTNDYHSIVTNRTPLIDVRAPVEYNKGAFPNAYNFPLLDDDERHEVGLVYKEKGKEKAIELGYRLVSGKKKEDRVNAWVQFIQENPHAVLYCFRGGKRSRISQEWIHEARFQIPRLASGYKGFRQFLLSQLENPKDLPRFYIVGGRTGSGKTLLLRSYKNFIDLEKHANHLGSSFGRQINDQPTQINYENSLSYDLIQKAHEGFSFLLLEDEGKNIGRLYLTKAFYEHTAKSSVVVLETPLEKRVQIVSDEYVVSRQKMYYKYYGENGLYKWADDISQSIDRIKKRMGGDRHKKLKALFNDSFKYQIKTSSMERHYEWIQYLLVEYYDPMYDYQLSKKEERILFRGNKESLHDYLSII